jgi:predicted nucleic acid-binding protein
MAPSDSLVVLDTSVISIIYNQDRRAAFYESRLSGTRTVVSFQTLEDLKYGAHVKSWGEWRSSQLTRHIEQYDVVWPNHELVDVCARLRSDRRSAGRELKQADAWIAATALYLTCPLASDDGDFGGIPYLRLIRGPK